MKIGANMKMVLDYLEVGKPSSVAEVSRFMRLGPQYALDTLERLEERGLLVRRGSNSFSKKQL